MVVCPAISIVTDWNAFIGDQTLFRIKTAIIFYKSFLNHA